MLFTFIHFIYLIILFYIILQMKRLGPSLVGGTLQIYHD